MAKEAFQADASGNITLLDRDLLREKAIDALVRQAVLGQGADKTRASWVIRELGEALGIYPASIHAFYQARGREEIPPSFTVPAINLRTLTYDSARAVFRAALARQAGAMIFEIARSEISYTDQRPLEYLAAVTAAAIKEGYEGPLFLQGDHFQISAKKYRETPEAETRVVEDLIREAIEAGFYNIDIDTSTLVDLDQPTVFEQQRVNFELCVRLTAFIRKCAPEGITVSVGGEIGEVGGKNSDETELRAFMDGFLGSLPAGMPGLAKISIQTGTSHGGVVLPDGSLAQVAIDFNCLKELSRIARQSYGMGGTVQHGASTLPDEAFNQFVSHEAIEVHLATGFQNIIYDHERFPRELRDQIYDYLKTRHAGEWKSGKTEEQFLYSTRKKGMGPFKAQLWGLPLEVREAFGATLEDKFGFLFDQLKVGGTKELVCRYAPRVPIQKATPKGMMPPKKGEDASDLSD